MLSEILIKMLHVTAFTVVIAVILSLFEQI